MYISISPYGINNLNRRELIKTGVNDVERAKTEPYSTSVLNMARIHRFNVLALDGVLPVDFSPSNGFKNRKKKY